MRHKNSTTHTVRYVDGAYDVIRLSDKATVQTHDTYAAANEAANRLSTRQAEYTATESRAWLAERMGAAAKVVGGGR